MPSASVSPAPLPSSPSSRPGSGSGDTKHLSTPQPLPRGGDTTPLVPLRTLAVSTAQPVPLLTLPSSSDGGGGGGGAAHTPITITAPVPTASTPPSPTEPATAATAAGAADAAAPSSATDHLLPPPASSSHRPPPALTHLHAASGAPAPPLTSRDPHLTAATTSHRFSTRWFGPGDGRLEYAAQAELFGVVGAQKVVAFDSRFREAWEAVMSGYEHLWC
jgi:hypothetical protein